jgi:HD superfamily phosphohydrolase
MVTGAAKPVSEILNGSMDVDNLDNVRRFQWATEGVRSTLTYSPLRIARAFRLTETGWMLRKECEPEIRNWQEVRAAIYRTVYGEPHFPAAMMLYRAVELAFTAYALPESFFFLTDAGALAFLESLGISGVSDIIACLNRWDWYSEAAKWDFPAPHAKVAELAKDWQGRRALATEIVRRTNIPEHEVCVYIGKGKEKRAITVPFVDDNGIRTYDTSDGASVTRIRVYVHPRHERMRNPIFRRIPNIDGIVREFCEI